MECRHSLPGYASFTGCRDGVLHLDPGELFPRDLGFSYFRAPGYRGIFRRLVRCGSQVWGFRASWSQIMAACSSPMTPGGCVRSSALRKRKSKKDDPIKTTEKRRLVCKDGWQTGAKIKAHTWEDAVFGPRYMDARLQFPASYGP